MLRVSGAKWPWLLCDGKCVLIDVGWLISQAVDAVGQTRSTRAVIIEPGDIVTMSADYRAHDDARLGPLTIGDLGVVVEKDGSAKPYHVRHLRSKRTWWYVPAAITAFTMVGHVL
jgi:hypothetical protein